MSSSTATGRSDLAIGAPADSVQGQQSAGAVNVLYRWRRGLSEAGDEQFTKAPQGIVGVPPSEARLGAALAAGDVDGDGLADLAIGAPGEDVAAQRAAGGGRGDGAVRVLRPVAGARGCDRVEPEQRRGQGGAEALDEFGAALAIGDFARDQGGG